MAAEIVCGCSRCRRASASTTGSSSPRVDPDELSRARSNLNSLFALFSRGLEEEHEVLIVLDFSLQLNNNVVVSYANNIPVRIDIDEYSHNINETDRYHEAYDGTMISVYNYQDEWHFGTSSCPDVNNSKFSNPKKTHGEMLDEVLLIVFYIYFIYFYVNRCH